MNDELAVGLQEHQRGLLAQAVRQCCSVLRAQPCNVPAKGLLR
jgi:hypothetical protein